MQKLEVYIEENVHGSIRPVEIVADAPVSALVPALVEELKLPRADVFGKPMVYMLRYAFNGRILPEQKTLLASGVKHGTQLVLDTYSVDGSVATMMERTNAQAHPDALFHSSDTANDDTSFTALTSVSNSAQGKRRVTRRAFLAIGGVILGAGTIGAGYAAFRTFNKGTLNMANMMGAQPTKTQKIPVPTTPMIPTTAKTGIVFTGHQQVVRTVAWSPDGTMLASGSDDKNLLLWGIDGTVHQMIAHPASVLAVAWSPDSRRLVTGSNNQVLFVNAQTGIQLGRSIHRHTAAVTSLAWTGKNQQLQVVSGGADNHAIVWDTTTYHSQTIFTRHTTPIESVSWAADGQTVASSSQGGAVRVWNAANGQEVHAYYLDANVRMRVLASAPTGSTLAVGGEDGIVRLWNASTCQQQAIVNGVRQCVDVPQRIHVSQMPVRSLAWSSDGKFLAVGSNDGVFTLWYPEKNQKPLLTMTIQPNTPVHSITWAPKGNQLAVAAGTKVTLMTLM